MIKKGTLETNKKEKKDMTEDKLKGETGLEMTDLEWLVDHHITKEEERLQMVEYINPKSGDKVLDLGCGPGLWTPMFADKVKPNGKVVGIDFSHCLISHAEENIKEEFKDIIEFRKSDFYNIPFDNGTFDLVFFGNSLAYVDDHKKLLEEIKRVSKEGGKIAIKDI